MKEFEGRAEVHIAAEPQSVFDLITDVDKLPSWNKAIEAVSERPPALTAGAEWVVVMHPPRMPRWKSRSRVEEVDRAGLRFAYRTRNEDGNPSYVDWRWEVAGGRGGSEVTVTWDVHLETIDRRLLAGPIRRRQLAREVPASLQEFARVLTTTTEAAS
jgi:uncharacterized protein YndB with AHSA1/START domain